MYTLSHAYTRAQEINTHVYNHTITLLHKHKQFTLPPFFLLSQLHIRTEAVWMIGFCFVLYRIVSFLSERAATAMGPVSGLALSEKRDVASSSGCLAWQRNRSLALVRRVRRCQGPRLAVLYTHPYRTSRNSLHHPIHLSPQPKTARLTSMMSSWSPPSPSSSSVSRSAAFAMFCTCISATAFSRLAVGVSAGTDSPRTV